MICLIMPMRERVWDVLSRLTVCAAEDRGVLCTGVRLWLRLSHSTICPEYVPPTTRLGWNCANPTDITDDYKEEELKYVSEKEGMVQRDG